MTKEEELQFKSMSGGEIFHKYMAMLKSHEITEQQLGAAMDKWLLLNQK